MVLVTLAHHIDVEFLKEAFRRTRKDGAPGVDGRHGGRIRGEAGRKPPVTPRSAQVRSLQGTAGPARPHPERRRNENPTHRHPHHRGTRFFNER